MEKGKKKLQAGQQRDQGASVMVDLSPVNSVKPRSDEDWRKPFDEGSPRYDVGTGRGRQGCRVINVLASLCSWV
jgi:hypothetical protein